MSDSNPRFGKLRPELENSQAADALRKYHGTGEINFKVADKDALMQAVAASFADATL